MASIEITESEVFAALEIAGTAPKDARTVEQLVAKTGRRHEAVRAALRRINAQGRLVVHHTASRDIAGRNCTIPAYTITSAKRKK
jgi:hypothetical protein